MLLDVPHASLEQGDGVEHVSGWGERGGVNDASHPAGELPDLVAGLGPEWVGLRAVVALRQLLEELERLHVDNARDQKWSWQEIATALRVTGEERPGWPREVARAGARIDADDAGRVVAEDTLALVCALDDR